MKINDLLPSLLFLSSILFSANPLAAKTAKTSQDSRFAKPVTLHDYHPFRKVDSKEGWAKRKAHIVDRIKVGSGIWPEPTKTPINAVVRDTIKFSDFKISKVYFESFPGHFVTGSLFEPAGESLKNGLKKGKRPGVLCPHGHWRDARFYHLIEVRAKQLIAYGEERFMNAAYNHIRARCIQLARMGCVVFQYDMIGNADSIQFKEHRRGPRKHLESKILGEWGLQSTMAVAHLQTFFGIQTWNSVRALDFLTGRKDVDDSRLLITGASGGGTQTQILATIDDRIDASFPCVMPSTAMQGGCTCENTHYLRIGQGNIDIAAAVAPRPQGMTAADDWTIELETKGYPDLVALYDMVGAKNRFQAHFDIHFKHNYNHVSRTHMYNFTNRHFQLGFSVPVLEQDFPMIEKEQLTVWGEGHPAPGEKGGPKVGDDHEKRLLRWWTTDSEKQLADLSKSRKVLQTAAEIMIGREVPEAKEVTAEYLIGSTSENIEHSNLRILNKTYNEVIPAQLLKPAKWNGQTVLWIFPEGNAGVERNYAQVGKLLNQKYAVLAPDLFGQGQSKHPDFSTCENPRVQYPGNTSKPSDTWRLSSVYFYGYNHSLFAKRVHDILTCVAHIHAQKGNSKTHLIAGAGAGHWGAAARAIAGDKITKAALDTSSFRFANLDSQWHADFLPGAVKYGDIAGLLSLSAPHPLYIVDQDLQLQSRLQKVYSSAKDSLTFYNRKVSDTQEALIEYFLK